MQARASLAAGEITVAWHRPVPGVSPRTKASPALAAGTSGHRHLAELEQLANCCSPSKGPGSSSGAAPARPANEPSQGLSSVRHETS